MEVSRYLVEIRDPRREGSGPGDAAARVRSVCRSARDDGFEVRFVRSIYVPEDETCFFLIEAPSPRLAISLLGRAGVAVLGVEETVAVAERATDEADPCSIDPQGTGVRSNDGRLGG